MLETRHHWLPITIAIYVPVSFIITYAIAVHNDHVAPGFPYISYTGTLSPESCVFSQLLNIGAVLGGFIIYTRYRQCLLKFREAERRRLIHLNTAAFIAGLLAVFGISLVGNFQATNVVTVHFIGAVLAFGVGFVYVTLQTVISYKSIVRCWPGNTPCIRRFRVALCVVDLILLITFITAREISKAKGPGPGNSFLHWGRDDPGYAEHLVAAVSEWLVAFVTVIYFATFYTEFKHFRMSPPNIVYYDDEQRPHGAEVSEITVTT